MGNFDADVTFRVEAAFGVLPYTTPTSTEWTEITGWVKEVNTETGRTHELDEIDAGTATLRLDNQDRRFDPSNTGSTYSPYVRPMTQVRIGATYSGSTYPIFYGYVESWPQSWMDGQFAQETSVKLVDGFQLLSFVETATTHAAGELTGNRVSDYLDEAGWSTGKRVISAGVQTLAAYAANCSSILAEIRRVADSEDGIFYMDREGNATFESSTGRTGGTPVSTFSDTGQVPYVRLAYNYDSINIWNDITVTPETSGVAPVTVEDTGSIDTYGRRKWKVMDTIQQTATGVTDVANRLLAKYKDPRVHVTQIEVTPRNDPTVAWPAVLDSQLSKVIRVRRTPPTGSQVSEDLYIESITHNWNVDKIWTTEFTLSPST